MKEYPVTIQFGSDKADIIVEAACVLDAIFKARGYGMKNLPSFTGDDIGMSIKVHVHLPKQEKAIK